MFQGSSRFGFLANDTLWSELVPDEGEPHLQFQWAHWSSSFFYFSSFSSSFSPSSSPPSPFDPPHGQARGWRSDHDLRAVAPPHLRDDHPGRPACLAQQDHLQKTLGGNDLPDGYDARHIHVHAYVNEHRYVHVCVLRITETVLGFFQTYHHIEIESGRLP